MRGAPVCGGLEALLGVYDEEHSFLEAPVQEVRAVLDAPVSEGPGARVGPYKLLEPIGEGGFGVVFMAEQHQPIRRMVALKIVKPGMDTRQVDRSLRIRATIPGSDEPSRISRRSSTAARRIPAGRTS